MREAVIVSIARTAVGKAYKGTLRNTRPDDMAAVVIDEVIKRVPGLKSEEIDDVIMGCAMPEAEQGMNVARIASLRAGIPHSVPGMTINRFCASGLQSIAMAAERIMCGFSDVIVAGGTESMTLIPMGGHKIAPNPYLVDHYPDAYLGMGLTAENLARKYDLSRQQQDEFALRSHERASKAMDTGKFNDEIVPLTVELEQFGPDGDRKVETIIFDKDEGPRRDTSLEALGKLKPAFAVNGTVTAGNASQMSDGAAAAVVMSRERADRMGLTPIARFVVFTLGGVAPEEMGIGPVEAIPRALKSAGLTINDIDVIELNEAFAAQSLAVVKHLDLDLSKINLNGGAIALGHPLGCTGAKLTASLLYEMKRRGSRYGMVTMCIGGGMGAAGIFERMN